MKTGDLLKIFFICVCLWYVTEGQECGVNPLKRIDVAARKAGMTVEYVLEFMKNKMPNEYANLEKAFKKYLRCVGLVDTGYFKRSLKENSETSQDQFQRRGERGLELPGALKAAVGSSNTQRMLTGKRSVAAAAAAAGHGGGDANGAAQRKSL